MSRYLESLRRFLHGAAGLILIALVAVTFIDVFGRYFLNTFIDVFGRYFLSRPLPGGHVLVQCLVCLLIFTGLPIIVLSREHLRVRLIDQHMTSRIRRWRDRTVDGAITICLLILAGQLIWQAMYFADNGEYFESIRIPLSWMASYAAFATSVAALLGLLRLFAGDDAEESEP